MSECTCNTTVSDEFDLCDPCLEDWNLFLLKNAFAYDHTPDSDASHPVP